MDRRLSGALLVVTVLVVAIIVPARGGMRVAGEATMIQLPAEPHVGDCLADEPGNLMGALEPVTDTGVTGVNNTGSTAPSRRHSSAEGGDTRVGPLFRSCTGQLSAAEVVAIVTAVGDPQSQGLKVQETGLDCRVAGLQYAGLVPMGDYFALRNRSANDPVTWRLSIAIRSAWIYPTPFLQAQGQTWAACVIAPSRSATFAGQIADAFDGGTLPSDYGTCWNAHEISAGVEQVDCRQPHLSELISAGFVPEGSDTGIADVKSSCLHLAARVVRKTDPTSGGALVVKTSPEAIGTNQSGRSMSILCYLTSTDRPLAGTLIGLGDQPLPYAN